MTAPRVAGVDLSLTSTGIAVSGPAPWTERITTPSTVDGLTRIRQIVSTTLLTIGVVDLVVLEGPSYGSSGRGTWDRAGLWWMLTDALTRRDIPLAVASPAARALYATGRGNAGKDDVLRDTTRRFSWFDGGNDEADAAVLMAMGMDHLGHALAVVPDRNRGALAKVSWPVVAAAA